MSDEDRALRAPDLLLLAALCLALFLPGLVSIPPVDRDESRYVVATSQMLDSGDFVDIRFQDGPRYQQPAGIYWLQSLGAAAFTEPGARKVWAFRLPSLAGALIASLGAAVLAAGLLGRRTGLVAGALLAACLSLGFEAHIAKTDAALLACVVVAQFSLMRLYLRPQAGRRPAAAFWLALGAGVMLKGPVILIVSGLTIAAVCLWDREAAWLRRLRPALGVPLMLALALPWYVAIGLVSHGDFFAFAVGKNLLGKVGAGQQSHGAPPGYHLLAFPATFWPGSLLVMLGLRAIWRERLRPEVRFLLCWIAPTWIVFESVATKLPHYVLPTFPALACLAALTLDAPKGQERWVWRTLQAALLVIWVAVSLLVCLLAPAALWLVEHRIDALAIALSALALAAVGAALWSLSAGRRQGAVAALAAAAALVAANVYGLALPGLQTFWISARAAQAVAAHSPCPHSPLVTTPLREPSLVFLHGPDRTQLFGDPALAADALARLGPCATALVDARQQPAFLARAAARGLALTPAARVRGRNYSDGESLDLVVFVQAPGAGRRP